MSGPMADMLQMEFERDTAKSNAGFVRRSFDFTYAARAFLDPHRASDGTMTRNATDCWA